MSLQKPLLPECFLHWIETAPAGDDDIFRLASWRRNLTLKGQSFRQFQTDVVPLLTGTYSVDEISHEVADTFRKEDLVAAFDLLAAQGILVEGNNAGAADQNIDLTPQLGWLSENAPDGRSAQSTLTDAHVVLFGAGCHGAVVARALVSAGLGKLTIIDPSDVLSADPYFSNLFRVADIGQNRAEALASALADGSPSTIIESHGTRPTDAEAVKPMIDGASLVLCCLESGELNLALHLNMACHGLGTEWIAASLEGAALVVGPGFFQTGDGPCYLCWRMREMAGAANLQSRVALETRLGQLQTDLSARRENLAMSADIVGGMLAAEALTWLIGTGGPSLDGRFHQMTLPGLQMEKHTVLRKPGCPVCSAGGGATA